MQLFTHDSSRMVLKNQKKYFSKNDAYKKPKPGYFRNRVS